MILVVVVVMVEWYWWWLWWWLNYSGDCSEMVLVAVEWC